MMSVPTEAVPALVQQEQDGEERARLVALAAYGLENTPPEADFDAFAALAADLLGLPIGLLNLVGAEQVTVKGHSGTAVETVAREHAFCSETVLGDDTLSIPDLRADARFADNPFVTGEAGLRFYAGTPLVSPLGRRRVGTLCVLGRQPRAPLDERERRVLRGLAALAMDRMELRRSENGRRNAQARFERLATATPGAIICADRDGLITYWNVAAERLLGWSAAEALGRDLAMIVPEHLREAHRAGMTRLVGRGDAVFPGRTVELPALRRDGSSFPAQVTLASWFEDGIPAFGAAVHDVTARRTAEDRLRFLAHHDVLTGCINRVRLAELVEEATAKTQPAAAVLLDLDGFKRVNDAYGHATGDALLREVGARLTAALGERGVLGRLGGDEFVAWLPGCTEVATAAAAARDLVGALEHPVRVDGRTLRVATSAGVALAAPGRVATLLPDADLALYESKAAGRGAWRLFHPDLRVRHDALFALRGEVERAIGRGELELHYQPQVRLGRGTVIGAEALLRWRHPERGLLPPGAFLPALEAGPFAATVGDWAIAQGCRQAAAWRARGLELRVAVNLFAEQLRAGHLEDTVREALARWRLPPRALQLEVTETIALAGGEETMRPLRAVRDLGVGLALDDFGTGFASLSTLKTCPVNHLKIDRGFVQTLGETDMRGTGANRHDVAIIRSVLGLAKDLRLGVTAEGIETSAQSTLLTAYGCAEGQGYLFGRPGPAEAMNGLV